MKTTCFLLIALIVSFSACKKDDKDDVNPVVEVKNKTLTIVFSEDDGTCDHSVKYAGIQVDLVSNLDTLYTGISDADGKVVFNVTPLTQNTPGTTYGWDLKWATINNPPTRYGSVSLLDSEPVQPTCFQANYGNTGTMRVKYSWL